MEEELKIKDKPNITHYDDPFMEFKERRRFTSWRQKGHYYFDKIWQLGYMTREEAYKWLSERLNVDKEKAHFSRMNNETCKEAVYLCQQTLNDLRRLDLDFGDEPKTPFYYIHD